MKYNVYIYMLSSLISVYQSLQEFTIQCKDRFLTKQIAAWEYTNFSV